MFKSLLLENFKCFKTMEKEIAFSNVNLLTGSNGRGKSSLFQSVLLLSQSYELGRDFRSIRLSGKFLDLGSYKDIVYKGNKEEKIEISLTTDNDEGDNVKFVCKSGKNDGIETLIDDIYVDGVSLVNEVSKDAMGDNSGNFDKESEKTFVPTSTYEIFSQFANVFFVSAEREGPRNAVRMLEENVSDQIGIHGEKVINSLYERKEDFQDVVAKELSQILDGASVHVSSSDLEYVRILLDSLDGSAGFKPVNVGFGYSYVLPLVVLPLIVPANSKLFIENPEAHLHPGAQSRMMDFLLRCSKQKNIQLFIETHSDHIVNAMRIAVKENRIDRTFGKIVHIARNNNEPVIWQIELDKYGNLSDYPDEFLDEWGNQMAQLV